jgi:hypothetical protein
MDHHIFFLLFHGQSILSETVIPSWKKSTKRFASRGLLSHRSQGAGKSELALEYAYRYGDYAEIFWITNTSSTSSYAFMKPLDDKKPNLSRHSGDEVKKGRLSILLDAESGPIIDILLHKWDLD